MKIWRICKEQYAVEPFSGEGSRRYGGRWNSRGVPMVYASTSLALAAIEFFVHLEINQAPGDLVSIGAYLPGGEPSQRWNEAELPPLWWSDELAPVQALGDGWIRSKLSLSVLVPSIPMRQEWNVLVNPLHPRVSEVKVEPAQPFIFDARMFAAR